MIKKKSIKTIKMVLTSPKRVLSPSRTLPININNNNNNQQVREGIFTILNVSSVLSLYFYLKRSQKNYFIVEFSFKIEKELFFFTFTYFLITPKKNYISKYIFLGMTKFSEYFA